MAFPRRSIIWVVTSLLAFPVYSALSAIWSDSPETTRTSSLILLLAAATVLVVPHLPTRLLKQVSKTIPGAFMLLTAMVVLSTLLAPVDSGSGRVYSEFFDSPGRAGMTGALALLGATAATRLSDRRLTWVILGGSTFGVGFTISISGTRLALFSVALGLLVFVVQRPSYRTFSLAALAAVGALSVLLLPTGQSTNTPAVNELSKSDSSAIERIGGDSWNSFDSGRLGIWQEKLHTIGEEPWLGQGFDASQEAGPMMAHNQIITVVEEVGVLGLCLFIAFVWQLFCQMRPGFRSSPYLPLLVGSLALLLADSFLFGWKNPVALLTWLGVIMGVVTGELNRRKLPQ